MGHKVALNHKTVYNYDRLVQLGPQTLRLRPAPHSRTPVVSYSVRIEPEKHFLNWLQDPYGNFLGRVVVPSPCRSFSVEVDLVANLQVYNPFDFFLEPRAENYPFDLGTELREELSPYLKNGKEDQGPLFKAYCKKLGPLTGPSISVLVALNQQVQKDIAYRIRMEANVQSPEETLKLKSGSCRDSALLLLELLKHYGFAARFVSGYLIQLVPDQAPLEGPSGPQKDFCDLHAWAEAYIPGAGWLGLDPTSGLLAGEGHIPLAASPKPAGAAPIEGLLEACEVSFSHQMELTRLDEAPRPLKPYGKEKTSENSGLELASEDRLDTLGRAVDRRLESLGYCLTSGAEPTFVSDKDRKSKEWGPDALGPNKKSYALKLVERLKNRWANQALIQSSQGKWYPGESLPRWVISCYWRKDDKAVWKDSSLLAKEYEDYGFGLEEAEIFIHKLCRILGVSEAYIYPAYEDAFYFMLQERNLPLNVSPEDSKLADPEARARLAQVFSRGLDVPSGYVLPIQKGSWKSGPWPTRGGRLILVPGDSPLGLRLPLDSLPWAKKEDQPFMEAPDPSLRPYPGTYGIAPRAKPVFSQTEAETSRQALQEQALPQEHPPLIPGESAAWLVRTALTVQARNGCLYVFMPPARCAEDWFALLTEVEATAEACGYPVIIEGYSPPHDSEYENFQISPDPGVLEVNIHPAASWPVWAKRLRELYEEARNCGLSSVKFLLGGQEVGTGGACHWTLGGPSPLESPFIKRPDLLASWIAFTNNHPVLSYGFSGLFIGASSQAPRPDEGNLEAAAALELAFKELHRQKNPPPWFADRLFRNLLSDASGNTHRTEICIDKLYSPDHAGGRRGLVEFRGFEMSPHPEIALSQSLLLRALSTCFLEEAYNERLARWGSALRDRFMLPFYLWQDLEEILYYLKVRGFSLPLEPFEAHWNFRFPLQGSFTHEDLELELRTALEPWPVLGEEPGTSGTVRYVDSSVERLELRVKNWDEDRYVLSCRGYQIPLHLDEKNRTWIAGLRFKAWNLASGLHPSIRADGTVIIDIYDRYTRRNVAGCTYFSAHPAGRNYEEEPLNSFEAEARRVARFIPFGHSPGSNLEPPQLVNSQEFPHTLDLR